MTVSLHITASAIPRVSALSYDCLSAGVQRLCRLIRDFFDDTEALTRDVLHDDARDLDLPATDENGKAR
ncbi:hypothetical protein ACIQPS_33020 [Streptomyces sp. NPDC091290]|uniref:hypothetical protein n=1 Tax=Streptomyces sp. NPDC091290 TaxID=3365990 RepID=UPI00381B6802